MAPPPPSSSSSTTSVQVGQGTYHDVAALRIRPTTTQDTSSIPARFQKIVVNAVSSTSVSVEPSSAAASSNPNAAPTSGGHKKQYFTFDQVHPPSTSQHELFTATALPLISRFVEGFNCTILAYGQTSSGKTFSMTGIDLDADPADPSNGMGIIPRAVSTIFTRCKELKEERGSAWNYSIKGSFIEIYNEDLIDLLGVDGSGGRSEVQIREDKQGHIIWEGLREVAVKGSNEVMSLIRQGTSIRRTNETDMNAQSSRSHAIFSLTLTQKKFVGSGAPPRSSSPLPPGGRSPSRIGRPGSVLNPPSVRVSSPTLGRPGTPSFGSALTRGGRPASSLGFLSPDGARGSGNADDEHGEWVTVVSKFHFVDLAGSERLKRTAAAGERIKEGISINGGLLALGNVISALGDPARAKSNTASYIPYRDSKLTRLLQDSLGGNAHTLMIACVSPTEWNVGETINTLKYANRARNIKNRVVLNEKEEGWDDVEWLQGMVTRLRKEVKTIKEGGASTLGSVAGSGRRLDELTDGAGKKVLAQMAELQNNYEDLRGKFVERTEELTRLRRELAEKQRASKGGHIGGTAKYEEIVGPVIEEYEKTISAMEAELNLNRAALRHTNELYEEKEAECTELADRHSTTEMYVEELRTRVAKLSEREASTEAYIRDLEDKVKQYDESVLSSSGSITDLKREISRFKDTESYSSQYIADLETRLARSDESVLALRETVEKLEGECERRRAEVEVLQTRLENFMRDGESWRSDLEERERKVRDLEQKMEEWEARKRAAGEERERLGDLVSEVAKARKNLEEAAPAKISGSSTEGLSISAASLDDSATSQLIALQQTHTATLADLSSVTAKYRDALREIADLAAQLEEAKVNAPVSSAESLEHPTDLSPRRRMNRGMPRDGSEGYPNGTSRRFVFRHAASAESLHSRSLSQSVSLSQELSSARSRKASISSHGTSSSVSHSPSHSGSRPRLNLSISLPSVNVSPNERSVQSLEKEIMRLQEVLQDREAEISALEQSLKDKERVASMPIDASPANGNGEVSPLMHLSPKTINRFQELRRSLDLHVPSTDSPTDVDESLDRLNELMRSMAQKESSHRELVDGLNDQLRQVRRQYDELNVLSRDQALNMSMEIDALRKKHTEDLEKHREDLEKLEHLEQRQRELEEYLEQAQSRDTMLAQVLEQIPQLEMELLASLREAQIAHSAAMQELKAEHEAVMREKEKEIDQLLAQLKEGHDLREQLTSTSGSLDEARLLHEQLLAKLQAEHAEALQAKDVETHTLVMRMKEEHLDDLREQLVAVSAALDKAREEHEQVFGKLKADHEEELGRRSAAVDEMLESTRQQHQAELSNLQADQLEAIKRMEEQAAVTLQQTEEEYYNALSKLRADHAQALERQAVEAATALARLREEHVGEMRMVEIAREGSLSESESARDTALKELQEAHATAIGTKESQFAEDLQRIKDEHLQSLASMADEHKALVEKLQAAHAVAISQKEAAFAEDLVKVRTESMEALSLQNEKHLASQEAQTAEHATLVSQLREDSSREIAKLQAELQERERQLSQSAEEARRNAVATLQSLQMQYASDLEDVKQIHEQEILRLSESHETASSTTIKETEEQHATIVQAHTEEVNRLKAEYDVLISELQSRLSAAEEAHERQTKEKQKLVYQEERDSLQKAHEQFVTTLRQEHLDKYQLESHKAASDEYLHDAALNVKSKVIESLQAQLDEAHGERDTLTEEVERLRAELLQSRQRADDLVQETSKRDALAQELEKHRVALAETQENLQRTKDEMGNLQAEKNLQSQLVRSPSPGDSPATRPTPERGMSFTRLPPPTPPPTASHEPQLSTSSGVESPLDSPSTSATSVGHSHLNGLPALTPDPKLVVQAQQQAKQLEEQEAMIKTLNKQLTHCESDLQAHMDMVATLESSLGDSEKNLRKARMQATELARERDNLNAQVANLRAELHETKNEVVNVRRSIVEEKQSLEHKLDEERRAKERARAQLDSRMEELQRRKSKFACL
ncbi:kinesin [Obba rivulosa]|uniref:Kinesin n=1 Tax=Obba rivulosa TaxID=1052685 RepID=A0A8E2B1B3_9APHY|nr:kinesin [Obba rivulosa]